MSNPSVSLTVTIAVTELRLDLSPTQGRPLGRCFSVRTRQHRQIAYLRTDTHGEFDWGWVERPDGKGRRDSRDWAQFLEVLRSRSTRGLGT